MKPPEGATITGTDTAGSEYSVPGATIHQVAQEAGVSPSTVSNLLNGRTGKMLPETRERVEAAIRRLGYRPNRAARQLRTGRIQMIGLVVPTVANPFWGAFARQVEAAALAEGFHVLLCNSERDPERERSYIDELWGDGISGVILCSSLPSIDHLRPVLDRGMSLVAFDRTAQPGDPDRVVNVGTDNVLGAHLATRHLLELGHERLAFLAGPIESVNRAERLRGFEEALTRRAGAHAIVHCADTADAEAADPSELGREAALSLLSSPRPPTGIVAVNDIVALGVCAGIRDAGLRVGHDVSVVGYDDIMLARMATPALTTVRQPVPAMAQAAFGHLQRLMQGHNDPGHSELHRPELVVRDSTGVAGATGDGTSA